MTFGQKKNSSKCNAQLNSAEITNFQKNREINVCHICVRLRLRPTLCLHLVKNYGFYGECI